MFRRTFLFTAGAAAMLGLIGCQADTSPIGGMHDEVHVYPNVTLSQPSLQRALGFQEPAVTRTDNDLMHVSLPVRARSDETLHVEYRVIWYDDRDRPIPPEQSWTPVRLEPRQPQTLAANSSSTDAENYNFQLRWSRP